VFFFTDCFSYFSLNTFSITNPRKRIMQIGEEIEYCLSYCYWKNNKEPG
jgi:hypothetical protein